jgi:hypothetical protein
MRSACLSEPSSADIPTWSQNESSCTLFQWWLTSKYTLLCTKNLTKYKISFAVNKLSLFYAQKTYKILKKDIGTYCRPFHPLFDSVWNIPHVPFYEASHSLGGVYVSQVQNLCSRKPASKHLPTWNLVDAAEPPLYSSMVIDKEKVAFIHEYWVSVVLVQCWQVWQ